MKHRLSSLVLLGLSLAAGSARAGGADDEFALPQTTNCPFSNVCKCMHNRCSLTDTRNQRCRAAGGGFGYCDTYCSAPPVGSVCRSLAQLLFDAIERTPDNNLFLDDFINGELGGQAGR